MLQAGDCGVPGAQACIVEKTTLDRPDPGDLYRLTTGYLTETFVLLFAPIFALIFSDDTSAGLEILFLFAPAIVTGYAYAIPFLLTLVYILFGANSYLLSWLDNVLVFLIEHYLSNVQLLLPLVVLVTW